MTEPKKQSDKVETCIANAIELLEAADDIDKMISDYFVEQEFGSIDTAEEMQSARLQKTKDTVRSRICVAQEDCPIISLLDKKELNAEKAKRNYHEAHDLITRAALEQLVECSCGAREAVNLKAAGKKLMAEGVQLRAKGREYTAKAEIAWALAKKRRLEGNDRKAFEFENTGNELKAEGEEMLRQGKELWQRGEMLTHD